jgi:hypothetical protein
MEYNTVYSVKLASLSLLIDHPLVLGREQVSKLLYKYFVFGPNKNVLTTHFPCIPFNNILPAILNIRNGVFLRSFLTRDLEQFFYITDTC